MKVPLEKKKEEAIRRMEALNIVPTAIDEFADKGIVMMSGEPVGALSAMGDAEKKMVADFEHEHNALVYMVVRAYLPFGKCDSLLYVSDYQTEWEMDQYDISVGYVMTYTVNHDNPDCSEFGSIAYRSANGGVLRIG